MTVRFPVSLTLLAHILSSYSASGDANEIDARYRANGVDPSFGVLFLSVYPTYGGTPTHGQLYAELAPYFKGLRIARGKRKTPLRQAIQVALNQYDVQHEGNHYRLPATRELHPEIKLVRAVKERALATIRGMP